MGWEWCPPAPISFPCPACRPGALEPFVDGVGVWYRPRRPDPGPARFPGCQACQACQNLGLGSHGDGRLGPTLDTGQYIPGTKIGSPGQTAAVVVDAALLHHRGPRAAIGLRPSFLAVRGRVV